MTSFVILAGLMLAAALWCVLPALLRSADGAPARGDPNLAVLREQLCELDADLAAGTLDAASHLAARDELERRALEDARPAPPQRAPVRGRLAGVMLSVALLSAAVGLYAMVGTPAALDPAGLAGAAAQSDQAATHETNAMIERLARRLDSKPDDLDGWLMLARSYSTMGQHGKASAVFARLVTMHPDDAELVASYADTLAMANGKTLQGEPERLVMRALHIDANNVKANVLAGSAAFERADYALALQRWQKAVPLLTPGSDMEKVVQGNIEEAGTLAGARPAPHAAAAGVATGAVQGTVELDPALRAQVADADTVFIFARSAGGGPRFPLAVLRKQVKDLPFTFVLDDSMGMMPGVTLSSFATVMVGARISSTGSATAQAGEPEGLVGPVAIGSKHLTVRIGASAK